MRSFISAAILSVALITFTGCTKSDDDSSGGGGGNSLSQFQGDCSLKIANGNSCTPKEGPVALITLVRNNQEVAICTGTFLTSNTVLTAAHCFVLTGADSAYVQAAGENSDSADFVIHPNYVDSGAASPYDAAIITLEKNLDVDTLPLLLGQEPESGDTFNIIGYGQDENGNSAADQPASDSLKKAVMTYEGIEQSLLLATPGKGGQTICSGDSGGPAIMLNRDNLPGVIGIANSILGRSISQLEQCEGVEAAAFTDVQLGAVTDWILKRVPNAGVI